MAMLQKTHFSQQLRALRLRHNWTQGYIAEKVGTTTVNVSRWERGLIVPGLYFRQRLCDLFGTNIDELGLVIIDADSPGELCSPVREDNASSGEEPLCRPSFPLSRPLPYAPNPLFTGREHLLRVLENRFFSDQRVFRRHVQALCGLGGIGKTQIALEYAARARQRYTAVFWVHAESSSTVRADMASFEKSAPGEDPQNQATNLRSFVNRLQAYPGWLLILDDLTDFSMLEEIVALDPVGHILVTTNSQITGTLASAIAVEKMPTEEGALFLLRRAKLLSSPDTLNDASDALVQSASEIAQAMGGLPLALDQAGAYIEETGCSLQAYLSLYRQQPVRMLGRRGRFVTGHPDPVTTTILRAYEQIRQADPLAADLLFACACTTREVIPETLLSQRAECPDSSLRPLAEDKILLYEAISLLRTHSLITHHAFSHTLSLHPPVREVIRHAAYGASDRISYLDCQHAELCCTFQRDLKKDVKQMIAP